MSGQNPREIAVEVLNSKANGDYTEEALERALTRSSLSPKDRGLCHELVYGITRNLAALDWLIARKTGGRDQKPGLRNLLRLGLYQIFWMDRIPPHASVNETVELAKRRGFGHQSGFLNAVLRAYVREQGPARLALEELRRNDPSTAYSHPAWLVDRWTKRWGSEATLKLLQWNNTPPQTFARVNLLKTEAGPLVEQWRMEGVDYDFVKHDWIPENLVFRLKEHPPIQKLKSFAEGKFYIQDPSTLLAVTQLDVQSGLSVLDMCAAPGGKFTFIAQLLGGTGTLEGMEISPDRLELLKENCTRLGMSGVRLTLTDGETTQAQFDRILLDAPCSNTGVIRRRLDVRSRINPEEIARLHRTQLHLLRRAAAITKPGGTIVYSTCSLEPEENEEVVRTFLKEEPSFSVTSERTLLPFAEGADGAYAARLQKRT